MNSIVIRKGKAHSLKNQLSYPSGYKLWYLLKYWDIQVDFTKEAISNGIFRKVWKNVGRLDCLGSIGSFCCCCLFLTRKKSHIHEKIYGNISTWLSFQEQPKGIEKHLEHRRVKQNHSPLPHTGHEKVWPTSPGLGRPSPVGTQRCTDQNTWGFIPNTFNTGHCSPSFFPGKEINYCI